MATGMPCSCGSGLDSFWEFDARGIPLCKVCPMCRQKRLAGFRSDVKTDPNYWADEPIEEDDVGGTYGPEGA